MSDGDAEKIARLRTAHEAFNRGDYDEAMGLGIHPDFEFLPIGGQTAIRGAEAFRAWMEPDAFEAQVIEPLEFVVSGDRVLVRSHTRARGAMSGIEMETDAWSVWTMDDDGLITRLELFWPDQEAAARQAAGLEE